MMIIAVMSLVWHSIIAWHVERAQRANIWGISSGKKQRWSYWWWIVESNAIVSARAASIFLMCWLLYRTARIFPGREKKQQNMLRNFSEPLVKLPRLLRIPAACARFSRHHIISTLSIGGPLLEFMKFLHYTLLGKPVCLSPVFT